MESDAEVGAVVGAAAMVDQEQPTLLHGAAGLAANGHRLCYNRTEALLPAGSRRCYNRVPALLPAGSDVATMARRRCW
jgi:hypothetical protein